jgi:hypothetical protein
MNSNRRLAIALVVIGAALALFGALWTTCSVVSVLGFPIAGYGGWNLVAGLALLVVGVAMALRGRRLARSVG